MNVEQHITRRFLPQAKTVVSTLLKGGDDIQSFCALGLTAFHCERNVLRGLNSLDLPKIFVVVSDNPAAFPLLFGRTVPCWGPKSSVDIKSTF